MTLDSTGVLSLCLTLWHSLLCLSLHIYPVRCLMLRDSLGQKSFILICKFCFKKKIRAVSSRLTCSVQWKRKWLQVKPIPWESNQRSIIFISVIACLILTHRAINCVLNSFYCCSVAKSCLTLCDCMDWAPPGSEHPPPLLHYLPEFAQTHVHWVSYDI